MPSSFQQWRYPLFTAASDLLQSLKGRALSHAIPSAVRVGAGRLATLLGRRAVLAIALAFAPYTWAQATRPVPSAAPAQSAQSIPPASLSNEEAQALVHRVLQTELEAAQTQSLTHPMQYRLRTSSPRLTTTKLIVETKDGGVARLLAINDAPLSIVDEQAEQTRLAALLNDPSRQQHRQEREQSDAERAQKIMRALPEAFLYRYAGIVETPQGPSYRMTFQPNPDFAPKDIEANVLKAMAGELWINVAQQRVTRLQGKRLQDVDYGWGILGKLDQDGTLLLEQADIGDHQWRTTKMVLVMNARILFKIVKLDTTLELSQYCPIAKGLTYRQAIQLLNQK